MDAGEIRRQEPIAGGSRGTVPAGSVVSGAESWPEGLGVRFALAGAWVGVNDICFAIAVWTGVYRRVGPQRILQSIASGILGPAAWEGGAATAALGLFLHFVIAYGWTAVFLVALLRWPRLRAQVAHPARALVIGLFYGALVWLAMDFVVLPLSRARVVSVSTPWFWMQLVQHPFLVGLPIVWVLSGAWGRRAKLAAGTPS